MNRNVLLGGCEKALYIIIVLSTFATLDDIDEQIERLRGPVELVLQELARAVQDLRKRAGLRYGEPVQLSVVGDAEVDESALREHCSVVAVSRVALANPLSSSNLDGVELAVRRLD